MSTNIKINIYQIRKIVETVQVTSVGNTILDSNYLQNKTDNDINTKSVYADKIYVEQVDIADVTMESDWLAQYYTIEEDSKGNKFIWIDDANGQHFKRYIKQAINIANNSELPIIFTFYVNPQQMTPTYQKLITKTRTRGGWEIQHWGNNITSMRVDCLSGGLHIVRDSGNPAGRVLKPNESILDSTAWKTLVKLKNLYIRDHETKNTEDKTLLGMNFLDKLLIGYFVEFTGPTVNAQKPYLMDFSFIFEVQEERTIRV